MSVCHTYNNFNRRIRSSSYTCKHANFTQENPQRLSSTQKLRVISRISNESVRGIDILLFSFSNRRSEIHQFLSFRYNMIDSLSFLSGSLAGLTDALVKDDHPFHLLEKANLCATEEERTLLLRKGVCYLHFVRYCFFETRRLSYLFRCFHIVLLPVLNS